MASRAKARKRALDLLFEADQRRLDPARLLQERLETAASSDSAVPEYAAEIVTGVTGRLDRIDELLSTYSTGWPMERMPAVDRTILRMGVWEILFNDDVPDGVAMSEAVALAEELSTNDSPVFVNGLLGRIESLKPSLID